MVRLWLRLAGVSIGLSLGLTLSACQSGDKQSGSTAGSPAAKVNPTALQAQAQLPPPPTATKKASIGSGAVSVNAANSPGDSDSFWVQQIDIDGDGDMEQTQLLWDDEDKVLFAYAEADVMCAYGGTATVAMLAAVNGKGNPRGRPAGSGFYAIYFDGTECGADEAGLYGCTFNASGLVTAWAAVVVDSEGDEIDAIGVN